jgi:hypothetical protein
MQEVWYGSVHAGKVAIHLLVQVLFHYLWKALLGWRNWMLRIQTRVKGKENEWGASGIKEVTKALSWQNEDLRKACKLGISLILKNSNLEYQNS